MSKPGGSLSLRIYQQDLQEKVFEAIGISQEEAEQKFGFLLDAFKYGAPPHAGIALGLDRLVMLMLHLDSIRDVIAFPKTQSAIDPLTQAPSVVADKQLKELHIADRSQERERKRPRKTGRLIFRQKRTPKPAFGVLLVHLL